MTRRDRMLLVGVVPVLLLAALWFFALSPKRDEAQRLDEQVAAAHTRLATAQGEVATYRAARDELAANLEALASAGRAVPTNMGVPALLRQLEATGDRAGINVRAIASAGGQEAAAQAPAPVDPAAGADPLGGATPVDVTLTLGGRYFDVRAFFARLDRFVRLSQDEVEATGRLLSVRDVTLSSKRGRLTAQVLATIYVLPDLRAELAAAAANGGDGGAAAGAVPATPAPGTLATAAVSP